MNLDLLETSQIFTYHPLLGEKETDKMQYLKVLDYLVRKYSEGDPWGPEALRLYIKKFLEDEGGYRYGDFELQRDARLVLGTRFRPFHFFSYRDCFLLDSIFLCAYEDKEKGERILAELESVCPRRHRKKIRLLFDALYDSSISVEVAESSRILKSQWDRNREYIEAIPIIVLVTANMSAGKSTLLNALIGKKVNRTKNDACTAKLHLICNKPFEDGFSYKWDHQLELDADYQMLMEDHEDNQDDEINVGTYFRTVGIPEKRIWLLDTPGVNSSQDMDHKLLTEQTICDNQDGLDLMIYLLNGENIGTDDDRKHLLFVLENYPGDILFVVNKLDRFREKEDSVAQTLKTVREDLAGISFKNPKVVPVSSYAAYLAKQVLFSETLEEEEQEEYARLSRKMKKPEYQLNSYYPEEIQAAVSADCEEESQLLLLHSGLMHLEQIIYNMR